MLRRDQRRRRRPPAWWTLTSSSGGSSDTEVKLLAVSPTGAPSGIEAGDDRHPRREAAERVAQRPRVGSGAIFAMGASSSAMRARYTGRRPLTQSRAAPRRR